MVTLLAYGSAFALVGVLTTVVSALEEILSEDDLNDNGINTLIQTLFSRVGNRVVYQTGTNVPVPRVEFCVPFYRTRTDAIYRQLLLRTGQTMIEPVMHRHPDPVDAVRALGEAEHLKRRIFPGSAPTSWMSAKQCIGNTPTDAVHFRVSASKRDNIQHFSGQWAAICAGLLFCDQLQVHSYADMVFRNYFTRMVKEYLPNMYVVYDATEPDNSEPRPARFCEELMPITDGLKNDEIFQFIRDKVKASGRFYEKARFFVRRLFSRSRSGSSASRSASVTSRQSRERAAVSDSDSELDADVAGDEFAEMRTALRVWLLNNRRYRHADHSMHYSVWIGRRYNAAKAQPRVLTLCVRVHRVNEGRDYFST